MEKDKNDEENELSNVISEQIPSVGSHYRKATIAGRGKAEF